MGGKKNTRRRQKAVKQKAQKPEEEKIIGCFREILKGSTRLTDSGLQLLDFDNGTDEERELAFADACIDMMRVLVDAGCPVPSQAARGPEPLRKLWKEALDRRWEQSGRDDETEAEQSELKDVHGGDTVDEHEGDAVHGQPGPVNPEDGGPG
jgi:hypothetical protein